MHQHLSQPRIDMDPTETTEWLEALDQIVKQAGPDRANFLLAEMTQRARANGVHVPVRATTPYVNSIPVAEEVAYPGDLNLERRVKSINRWNAMQMVVRQNKLDDGIGGHIATYQSLATMLEVGFNHFFRGSYGEFPGDAIYFQGHSSPGVYARAFLEGRLTEEQLNNFRHELRGSAALSSYPHPWLMPDFWQFPTVSMGIGPLCAIYQARFMRYLENRGIIPPSDRKVWAFLGDGEMDEPESTGALRIAAAEGLDNLIFVVNCNLQRLDGPVRGNGKIIQELEGTFNGGGWRTIKCIWGSNWDALLARDTSGRLVQLMEECVDGEYQAFKANSGAYVREHFFGRYPETAALVADMSDQELEGLRRGGHDPVKVYNAYKAAVEHKGSPVVVLAKTVKGYGMGKSGESRNAAHQAKKPSEEDIYAFPGRFGLTISKEDIKAGKFYRPDDSSPEIAYMHERRRVLGGYVPSRKPAQLVTKAPDASAIEEFRTGSKEPHPSTTMAFVRLLTRLMKLPDIGKKIVPIYPDEARTFGMEAMFRNFGIYSPKGQLYKPHDSNVLLYYKESQDGQILEEGITEAGAMACFTAAGTSYANLGVDSIPFYIYYSMFGFQRIGDLAWAFADARGKGFLLGATAGRTTLMGEGLQHQDGHSLLLSSTIPTLASYDPAYAYEIAVIVREGIRRMYEMREDLYYYLTLYNETYPQMPMPEGSEQGILEGLYLFSKSSLTKAKARVQLIGSGPMVNEALMARTILEEKYGVAADIWSATSYNELRREALKVERWNRLHPTEPARKPRVQQIMENSEGPIIAASDFMKAVPDQVSQWLGGRLLSLGTDGFGRSDNRQYLRRHFEVNSEAIAAAALSALAREGKFDAKKVVKAFADLGIDTEKIDPAIA